jgi:tetratricopeptide (TPR) repeat protein
MAIALAWQCRQLNDPDLGDVLVDRVLTGVPDDEQLGTTLAALEYLVQTGKYDRADALLTPILSSQPYSESPALWRLASQVAARGERLARSVSYLERAMNLEYESLPKRYDVEQVRERYGQLFGSYQKLAGVVIAPDGDAPLDLVGRSIKAADCWRLLDTDVTAACHNAAKLLNKLGRQDLAWDYLTTPLAMKPNEATAWLALAKTLGSDGEPELADRAYASAFQAEPTNAQILWDRAQLLEQAGRRQEAWALYRQIAEGQWQPRFDSIKRQAEGITASDP